MAMVIGGFEVGEHVVKEEGGKKNLIFDCRECVYSANFANDKACRLHLITVLQEVDADLIVLAEVYERVYNEEQTKYIKEIANLVLQFQNEGIWSYKHLGDPEAEKEAHFRERHDSLVKICHDILGYDPIEAYLELLSEIKREQTKIEKAASEAYAKSARIYLETLSYTRKRFEESIFFQLLKKYLLALTEIPETSKLYHPFFEAQVKPSFIGSRLLFGEVEKFELLDEYMVKDTTIQIFKHPNKIEKMYFINPPEYTLAPDKYFVLSKTREIVAGDKGGAVGLGAIAQSRKYFERIYESTIVDVAQKYNIPLSREEVSQLAEVVARYTVGYGILEILLNDRRLTDIYLDSPIGMKPIYVIHSDFGQCQTNIVYTNTESEGVVSKLRAMSGRPFDEAHPILDYDLTELETRVAVIGKPMATDGTAYAFRLHKLTPWTLPQFIDVKMLNPLCAGLLSFFIDMQSTMMICGSRGAGKTSLLASLMLEILQNTRVITQEDTLELPVNYMKNIGFSIQRLKTRQVIGAEEAMVGGEVAPEQALRTALRLGDSAIIIGEVRSKEAKVLYEAMRVGAAGNIVMGTVHADSAYSVWDRVVNDLGVPSTSFKATDLVVVARPIRFAGGLGRHRRLVQMTEIKKEWTTDPEKEGGLLDLMLYDAKLDSIELLEDNLKDSSMFTKIARLSGLSYEQIWQDIHFRASAKEFLVKMKNDFKVPKLLEAENTVTANNKLLLMKEDQLQELGSVNYDQLLGEWKNWVKQRLVKKLVSGREV